ncbi:MAG: alpha/beta fold hydrolase [Parafilimonas terrae]|nr:alpha/beta fold hydrolase [Parafilimonas terrae]
MDFEDVAFPSQDGVPLKGWFIPAAGPGPGPAIVFVHGWPWCRMGNQQNDRFGDLPGGKPVHLMPLARAYHDAGYNVLMFDMSGFGDSGRRRVYTSGWLEARDVLGALDFLGRRADVDPDRMGAIGFSVGGAVLCYAMPHTTRLRAAIAVQPSTPEVFSTNYGRDKFGQFGKLINAGSAFFYGIFGGPNLSFLQPTLVAPGARDVPVLYVQSTGDRWGTREDVARMAAATPRGEAIYPETTHRFDGYTYMVEHPEVSLGFFGTHMAPRAPKLDAAGAAQQAA